MWHMIIRVEPGLQSRAWLWVSERPPNALLHFSVFVDGHCQFFFSLFFQLIIMKTPQDILTTINNYVANITPPHEMWTMIAARDHGKSKVGNSPTTMKACQPIAKGDKAGLITKQAPIESLFTVPDYFCNLFSEPLTLRADQLSFST